MGFFEKLLDRRKIRPKAIAREIGHLIELKKTDKVYKICAPGRFCVYLSVADLDKFELFQNKIECELIEYIWAYVDKQGYHISTNPEIVFECDEELLQGEFRVKPILADTLGNTLIFGKSKLLEPGENDTTLIFTRKLPESPIPTLEIFEGSKQKEYNLSKNSITLGRNEDNQIVINDPNVSRYHARIFYDENWQIEDMNSTNGVLINNQLVKISKLKSGDEIKLGSTLLKFRSK